MIGGWGRSAVTVISAINENKEATPGSAWDIREASQGRCLLFRFPELVLPQVPKTVGNSRQSKQWMQKPVHFISDARELAQF